MAELKITAANFENEVLRSDKPVLLDFYADWCGPCKMLSPILHELAEEKSGTLKVGKVNVDEQMELAMRFQVSSIPMLVVFKDGKAVAKSVGYRSLHLTIRLPVFFAEKEIHVPVEIQLRTIAMDFWASLEHTIRYKKNLPINTEIETELKECADSSREWDGKMEHLLHIIT